MRRPRATFDLTDRIVTADEGLTGRRLDRRRIDLLTGVHGLSELADLPDDPIKVRAGVERCCDGCSVPARAAAEAAQPLFHPPPSNHVIAHKADIAPCSDVIRILLRFGSGIFPYTSSYAPLILKF